MRLPILAFLLIANRALLWSQAAAPEIKFRENMPTKDGFSAELRLNANKAIFEEITPNPEHLEAVTTAKRGQAFYTVVLFANAASKFGRTDLTYDIVIKKPDGTVYGGAKGMVGLRARQESSSGLVHVAAGTLAIKIDPGDPDGLWTVEADIHDNARATTIHSERSFSVLPGAEQ